jgi:hypothetical protein
VGLVDAETGDGYGLPGPFVWLVREQIVIDRETTLKTELEQVQAQIASLQSALDDKPDCDFLSPLKQGASRDLSPYGSEEPFTRRASPAPASV